MPVSREKIFKEINPNNAFLPYDLYGQALSQGPSAMGVMKFTLLVDPSLVNTLLYT